MVGNGGDGWECGLSDVDSCLRRNDGGGGMGLRGWFTLTPTLSLRERGLVA